MRLERIVFALALGWLSVARADELRLPKAELRAQSTLGYHFQSATGRRITLLKTGEFSEDATNVARFETLKEERTGARRKLVFWDNEIKEDLSSKQARRLIGEYVVTWSKPDAEPQFDWQKQAVGDDFKREVLEREKVTSSFERLTSFLSSRAFPPGALVALDPGLNEVLGLVGAALIYRESEERFQTRVASFSLEAKTNDSLVWGELYVEEASGFPLALRIESRFSQNVEVHGNAMKIRGNTVTSRRWGLVDAERTTTRAIETTPPRTALFTDALALAESGRFAVSVSHRSFSGISGVRVWDLQTRRIVDGRESDATAVTIDGSDAAFTASATSIDGFALASDGMLEPMGRAMIAPELATKLDLARAAAMIDKGVLVAYEKGTLIHAYPFMQCIAGQYDTGLSPVAIDADAQGRVVVVSRDGVVVFLQSSRARRHASQQYAACDRGSEFEELGRTTLPAGQYFSASVLGDRAAVSTIAGEVTELELDRASGQIRSEARGAIGQAVRWIGTAERPVLITESGTFDRKHTPERIVHSGLVFTLSKSGSYGVGCSNGVFLFRPGHPEETPPIESHGFPARHLNYEQGELKATSSVWAPRGTFSWDFTSTEPRFSPMDLDAGLAFEAARASNQVRVAADGGELRLRLDENGQLSAQQRGKPLYTRAISRAIRRPVLTVSADGQLLAAANTHPTHDDFAYNEHIPVVQLLDPRTGERKLDLSAEWGTVTAAAFVAGGAQLAAGTDAGEIYVWDTETGQLVERFPAHANEIRALVALPDRKLWATAADDETVRVWDEQAISDTLPLGGFPRVAQNIFVPARPTKLVATLYTNADGGAVIATADGYYTSARGNLRAMELSTGFSKYEFEQLDRLLNRPDIVLSRMKAPERVQASYREATARRRAVQTASAISTRAMGEVPKLKVTGVPLGLSDRRDLTLQIEAEAAKGRRLQRLIVRVNSIALTPADGQRLNGSKAKLRFPVRLARGSNRIDVYVIDQAGAPSPVVTHVVDLIGVPQKPKLYVLAVGVSDYEDPALDLEFAAKDALDLSEVLKRSSRYSEVLTRTLTDHEVTKEKIQTARGFLELAGTDDTVLVFFAGHGFLDQKLDYYFATTDTDPKAPEQRALRYDALSALVTGLEARNRVVLLDTCHSGQADDAPALRYEPGAADEVRNVIKQRTRGAKLGPSISRSNGFLMMLELFADQQDRSGAVVIASAGGAEFAFESQAQKNGLFTYALMQELIAASFEQDDVELGRLIARVQQRVLSLSRGAQRPSLRAENLDLSLVLY